MKLHAGLAMLVAALWVSRPTPARAECLEYQFVDWQCAPGCHAVFGSTWIGEACTQACLQQGYVAFTYDADTEEIGCTPGAPPPPPPPPPPVTKTLVLLHGRTQTAWPACSQLPTTIGLPAAGNDSVATINAGWARHNPSYDGSSRLEDPATKAAVRDGLLSKCTGGNECVVACYSTGCARLLLAFHEVGPQLTGLHWTFALSSAAGGSEAADVPKWIRDLATRTLEVVPSMSQPVDQDLTVHNMRVNYAHIQDASPRPMYHLGGTGDFCVTTGVRTGALWAQTFDELLERLCGGTNTASTLGWLAGTMAAEATELTICGNKGVDMSVAGVNLHLADGPFPGGYGDGVVPLHSSLGYRTAGAYAGATSNAALLYHNRVALYVSPHNHSNTYQHMGCPPVADVGVATGASSGFYFPSFDTISQCLQPQVLFNPWSQCRDACWGYYSYSSWWDYGPEGTPSCPSCYATSSITQCVGYGINPSTGACQLSTATYYDWQGPLDCQTGGPYNAYACEMGCSSYAGWNVQYAFQVCQQYCAYYGHMDMYGYCHDPWAQLYCAADVAGIPVSVLMHYMTYCH